jgi:hypothetical protein
MLRNTSAESPTALPWTRNRGALSRAGLNSEYGLAFEDEKGVVHSFSIPVVAASILPLNRLLLQLI